MCDLFDIPVSKANTRKEDLVAKLLDFIVAPHATSDVILADKEQATNSRKLEGKEVHQRALKTCQRSDLGRILNLRALVIRQHHQILLMIYLIISFVFGPTMPFSIILCFELLCHF